MAMGELDKAEELFLSARDHARSAGASLLFVSTNNLGELYLTKGQAQKSLALFEEALAMPASTRTPAQTGVLYHNLGTAEKDLGDPAKALNYYGKSLEVNLSNKLFEQAAANYYMMAAVHSRKGELDEAQKNAQAALDFDKRVENSPGIAQDLYALGLHRQSAQGPRGSLRLLPESYLVFTTLGIKPQMKKALTELIAAADELAGPLKQRHSASSSWTWKARERRVSQDAGAVGRGGTHDRILPSSRGGKRCHRPGHCLAAVAVRDLAEAPVLILRSLPAGRGAPRPGRPRHCPAKAGDTGPRQAACHRALRPADRAPRRDRSRGAYCAAVLLFRGLWVLAVPPSCSGSDCSGSWDTCEAGQRAASRVPFLPRIKVSEAIDTSFRDPHPLRRALRDSCRIDISGNPHPQPG